MTPPVTGPIFITGFPRSGTSSLARGLAKLPGFAEHGPEGHFVYLLDDAVSQIREDRLNPNCLVRDPAPQVAFLSAMAGAVDAAYCTGLRATSQMWIDKTPDVAQVAALPTIHALFPQAWIFYIYRDPVSVVRSSMATWPAELAGQELSVARRWCQCQATWRDRCKEIPAAKRLEIFQPDLRTNPQGVVKQIADLMGLTAEQADPLFQFWTTHRQVNRPTAGQAAAAYDAVVLDAGIADQVLDICAVEMAYWPRLAALAPTAATPLNPAIKAMQGLYPWEGPYSQMNLPRFAWVKESGVTLRVDAQTQPRRITIKGRSLFTQRIAINAKGHPLVEVTCPPGPFTLTQDISPGTTDLLVRSQKADRLSPSDARRTGWALYNVTLDPAS